MVHIIGASAIPLYVVYSLIILITLMGSDGFNPSLQCLIKTAFIAQKPHKMPVFLEKSFFQKYILKMVIV
jgi:hypothetical protein